MSGFFITGTDTDVGKTVVAAWATLHLDGCYWKPVQAGREPETDAETVRRLTGLPPERFLEEGYILKEALSPHEAAKREEATLSLDRLGLPEAAWPVVVEGAGGLMVPLNDDAFMIDLIAGLALPVILVCRSTLGTINHTLLSIEALRSRTLKIAGLVMNGPKTPHNREALETFGRVPIIAEMPPLEPLSRETLLGVEPEINLHSLLAGDC